MSESQPPHAAPPKLRVLMIAPSLRIMGGQSVMADELLRRMRADGLAVDFLPINPKPPGVLALAERVKGLRTLVVSLFYVASLLRRVRHYDVVHLFSASYFSFLIAQMPAILVGKLYGTPVLLNYHSGEAEDHLTHAGPFVFWLLRQCRSIAVQSGFLVDVFSKFGFDAVPISNVVEPARVPYRLRTDARKARIIFPRMLEPLYDPACALRAFAHVRRVHPNAQLTLLGEGSCEPELRAQIAELQLGGVTFAGRVEPSEIGDVYQRHDILLNTSTIDNQPVSLIEGFAAGLPIVTTDPGGIPYMVTDRDTGHLVGIGDDHALARRICELIESPEPVARLSRRVAEEARRYTWPRVAQLWYALYKKTVETSES